MIDSITFREHIAPTEIDAMNGRCSNCFSETRKWTEEEIITAKNERGMAANESFERWCDACLNSDTLSPFLRGSINQASKRKEPPSTSGADPSTGKPTLKCDVIPFPCNHLY